MNTDRVKKCYFYLPDNTINDATSYYCDIVEESFNYIGVDVQRINKIEDVNLKVDYTFSIRIVDFIKVSRFGKKNIFWIQGVLPEENLYLRGISFLNLLKYLYVSSQEFYVLKKSVLNLVVSNSMFEFYKRKNLSSSLPCFEMPCFNQTLLTLKELYHDKYIKPTFVYAGSLSKWQCVEDSLLIFKYIKDELPNASFTVLSKEKDEYEKLISKHNVSGVELRYVPLLQLQDYLMKFKYAFLLREKNIVNKVATPTKMNSYLASSVIPIYTDVIDSFEKNINLRDFGVKIKKDVTSHKEIAKEIVNHHTNYNIIYKELYDNYKKVFDDYYNRGFYVRELSEKLQNI